MRKGGKRAVRDKRDWYVGKRRCERTLGRRLGGEVAGDPEHGGRRVAEAVKNSQNSKVSSMGHGWFRDPKVEKRQTRRTPDKGT